LPFIPITVAVVVLTVTLARGGSER